MFSKPRDFAVWRFRAPMSSKSFLVYWDKNLLCLPCPSWSQNHGYYGCTLVIAVSGRDLVGYVVVLSCGDTFLTVSSAIFCLWTEKPCLARSPYLSILDLSHARFPVMTLPVHVVRPSLLPTLRLLQVRSSVYVWKRQLSKRWFNPLIFCRDGLLWGLSETWDAWWLFPDRQLSYFLLTVFKLKEPSLARSPYLLDWITSHERCNGILGRILLELFRL